MQMLPLKRIHFIGIGGAGMSAIAWVLLKKGIPVSGSDIRPGARTTRLEAIGARIFYGHLEKNIEDVGLVVISTAIREDNPELMEAKKRGIPVWHRSKMLAEILDDGIGITVAGTHGKTSTTAILSLILRKAELDPTILVGSEFDEIGGNAKLGQGEYVVAEADESDGSFLAYNPSYTIITNIEPDHLDYYKTGDEVKKAFQKFLAQVKRGGCAILCADDPGIRSIVDMDLSCGVCLYSLESPKADFYAGDIELFPFASCFSVFFEGRLLGSIKISVPGRHNISNAMAAISLGHLLGVDFDCIREAIESFHGTQRRFQLKGEEEDVLIVDDYAHHPTEVLATLKGAVPLREMRKGRIITIFQPHRYTRTKAFAHDFAASFDDSDIVILMDVYSAGEKEIPGVSGKLIHDLMNKRGHNSSYYIAGQDDISKKVLDMLEPGDIVITMGAGNVWQIGESLLKTMVSRKELNVDLNEAVKL
jgi:UDP-N-acetylmuramate--alanine ligase